MYVEVGFVLVEGYVEVGFVPVEGEEEAIVVTEALFSYSIFVFFKVLS